MSERWGSMNERTVNGYYPRWDAPSYENYLRKGIRLEISREDFYTFCWKYRYKIERLFRTGQVPVIDRIDPDDHYRLGNLQIINRSQNSKKANTELRKSLRVKPIIRISLETQDMENFPSIYHMKSLGFLPSKIHSCCRGRSESYAGYLWHFPQN